jgi:hypothetical protein
MIGMSSSLTTMDTGTNLLHSPGKHGQLLPVTRAAIRPGGATCWWTISYSALSHQRRASYGPR